jgi:hypothetical protein
LLNDNLQLFVHVQSSGAFLGFISVRNTEFGYSQVPAFIEREIEFRFLAVGDRLVHCMLTNLLTFSVFLSQS